MQEENKKYIYVAAGLLVVLVSLLFGKDVFIKKITSEVVKQLRREYAPGPYSPGFDPDKVDPSFFQSKN